MLKLDFFFTHHLKPHIFFHKEVKVTFFFFLIVMLGRQLFLPLRRSDRFFSVFFWATYRSKKISSTYRVIQISFFQPKAAPEYFSKKSSSPPPPPDNEVIAPLFAPKPTAKEKQPLYVSRIHKVAALTHVQGYFAVADHPLVPYRHVHLYKFDGSIVTSNCVLLDPSRESPAVHMCHSSCKSPSRQTWICPWPMKSNTLILLPDSCWILTLMQTYRWEGGSNEPSPYTWDGPATWWVHAGYRGCFSLLLVLAQVTTKQNWIQT